MTRRLIAIATAFFVTSSCAYAQVSGMGTPSPSFGMGMTSPLGMSPSGALVGPTGIPLGATELATPGVSPGPSSPYGLTSTTACSSTGFPGMGNAMTGTSNSTALFDAGGVGISTDTTQLGTTATGPMSTTTAPASTTTCGQASSVGNATSLQSSTSTPATFRLGIGTIPMGSTELTNPGLSPAPCPATGFTARSTMGTPMSSGAC